LDINARWRAGLAARGIIFKKETRMCDPIAMIGATVLGAAQQAQQAQQAAAQQSSHAWQAAYQTAFQTAQARNAATVSEYNAQDAERRGAVEEERQRRKTSLLLGTQQARFAAQGSDLEGSPLDLLGDTAAFGEQDAISIRPRCRRGWPTRIRAWGLPVRFWAVPQACSNSPDGGISLRKQA
jgi:multidrug efflux pump subunit AcrA (membrane-fusion protein)